MDEKICNTDPDLQLENFRLSLNSMGKGKGLAIYLREPHITTTTLSKYFTEHDYQLSIAEFQNITVIALYRSQTCIGLDKKLQEVICQNSSENRYLFARIQMHSFTSFYLFCRFDHSSNCPYY